MIIFSPCSVLGKVRTVPCIHIHTKLTINKSSFFQSSKEQSSYPVAHKCGFFLDIIMVEKNSGFDI